MNADYGKQTAKKIEMSIRNTSFSKKKQTKKNWITERTEEL